MPFVTCFSANVFARAHNLTICASCGSQVVEEGYEFFAKRQLVTIFSAPNYCGEFENAGAMMSVDETLMCSFQVSLVMLACLYCKMYIGLHSGCWDVVLHTAYELVRHYHKDLTRFAGSMKRVHLACVSVRACSYADIRIAA